jgi:hypothetical protein
VEARSIWSGWTLALLCSMAAGCGSGADRLNNEIEGAARPPEALAAQAARQADAEAALADKARERRALPGKQGSPRPHDLLTRCLHAGAADHGRAGRAHALRRL